MKNSNGYSFSEKDSERVVIILRECIDKLSETVAYVDGLHSEDVDAYKRKIAGIAADIAWDVLEQGFYRQYPNLRPLDSVLRENN